MPDRGSKLTIVGGTYLERCAEPRWYELYGSGLRAAAALSGNVADIRFVSCVGEDFAALARSMCEGYGIISAFTKAPETTSFTYHHPLAPPSVRPADIFDRVKISMPAVQAEHVLFYGLAEAQPVVNASYLVYDPQNRIPYKETGATADHLALVLNKHEALALSGMAAESDLADVGRALLVSQGAEVVVIKNGAHGAWVVEADRVNRVPVFKIPYVWSVGSGDIFSAVFAWQWAVDKRPAAEAAMRASQFTAHYCQYQDFPFPLPAQPTQFPEATPLAEQHKKVYLAGPFFTMAERWLINELRDKLLEFGNKVFSPLHDVGHGPAKQVVAPDLAAIRDADVILAVATGLDAGTLYEVGYARALEKRVVVLAENVTEHDLTMLVGSDCEITSDFTTAVYATSW